MVVGEFARFAVGDLHDVFDAAAAEAGVVESRFNRDDDAFAQTTFDGADPWSLVNLSLIHI